MRARSLVFPFCAAIAALGCDQSTAPQKDQAATASTEAPAADVMDECPSQAAGDSCADAPATTGSDQTHFGKAFELDVREPLSKVATRIGDSEETVQVTGTVEAVCKKKGCWMELRDGETSAKVFTYAGSFFLPVDTAKGRKAVVEGKLKAKTMSKELAQHLAEDQGEDPSQVTGPVKKLVIDAQSISLL